MTYMQSRVLQALFARVKPGCTQRNVGHAWFNLMFPYFTPDTFAVDERISKTGDEYSHVLVRNFKDGTLRTLLVMLAKNYPDPGQPENWDAGREQIEGYLLNAWEEDGAIQNMFGAVAIGDVVWFYELSLDEGELLRVQDDRVLHLCNDSDVIHEVLPGIARAALESSDAV